MLAESPQMKLKTSTGMGRDHPLIMSTPLRGHNMLHMLYYNIYSYTRWVYGQRVRAVSEINGFIKFCNHNLVEHTRQRWWWRERWRWRWRGGEQIVLSVDSLLYPKRNIFALATPRVVYTLHLHTWGHDYWGGQGRTTEMCLQAQSVAIKRCIIINWTRRGTMPMPMPLPLPMWKAAASSGNCW